jgi:hypothetical protein
LQHFAFHVAERDDLDAWVAHLDSLRIAHSSIAQEGPSLIVRFRDLDRIPIEVCWPDLRRCEEFFTMLARARASAARAARGREVVR